MMGDGFVVCITARVSDDAILDRCPENGDWLVNLVRYLRAEGARNASRYSALRRLQHTFRELKTSTGNEEEREARVQLALDGALETTLRRDAAQAARGQLAAVYRACWDCLCERLSANWCRPRSTVGMPSF